MPHASPLNPWRAYISLAAAVVLLSCLQALPHAWHLALRYDRDAVLQGELWRLVTGHLIHLGWAHWALNAVGLLVCGVLADALPSPRTLLHHVLVLSLGISVLLLLLAPDLAHYVGLSGVLYGLFILALWPGVRRRDPLSITALGVTFAWLCWQLVQGPAPREMELIGGAIIVQAHVYGVLCAGGLLAAGSAHAARAKPSPSA